MKTQVYLLFGTMLLTALFACSSVKVTSDYDRSADFGKYKTFGMYKLKTDGNISQLNADRIMNAIRTTMTAKGYTEKNDNPDLLVNAVTFLKEKQSVSASTNYYGYGGLYRPYGYWGGVGMGGGYTTVNTYDYKDGSLSIDVIDPATDKMIWQGVGNKDIDKAPDNPDEFISNAVTMIMESFPKAK